VARRGPETTTPLRRRLFGWPDTQGRCHRKVGRTGPASACSPSSPARPARRSGPVDQAPTVIPSSGIAVRGRRLSLAVPSFFGCDAASLGGRRRDPPSRAPRGGPGPEGCG